MNKYTSEQQKLPNCSGDAVLEDKNLVAEGKNAK